MCRALLTMLMLSIIGCGNEADETPVALVTYIDKDSGEVLQAPSQSIPGTNPKTGKQTLLLAGWCEQCQKWSPLPPNTNPGKVNCKIHKSPLTLNGPVPESTTGAAQ